MREVKHIRIDLALMLVIAWTGVVFWAAQHSVETPKPVPVPTCAPDDDKDRLRTLLEQCRARLPGGSKGTIEPTPSPSPKPSPKPTPSAGTTRSLRVGTTSPLGVGNARISLQSIDGSQPPRGFFKVVNSDGTFKTFNKQNGETLTVVIGGTPRAVPILGIDSAAGSAAIDTSAVTR